MDPMFNLEHPQKLTSCSWAHDQRFLETSLKLVHHSELLELFCWQINASYHITSVVEGGTGVSPWAPRVKEPQEERTSKMKKSV